MMRAQAADELDMTTSLPEFCRGVETALGTHGIRVSTTRRPNGIDVALACAEQLAPHKIVPWYKAHWRAHAPAKLRVVTISAYRVVLAAAEAKDVVNVRQMAQDMALLRLGQERLARATLDFDGSLMSTTRHAEGTAVGFNKKKKGARSYYQPALLSGRDASPQRDAGTTDAVGRTRVWHF